MGRVLVLGVLAGFTLQPLPSLEPPSTAPAWQPDRRAHATSHASTATRPITYGRIRIQVPAAWQVVRLDHEPGRCVRFDVHVVYLGRPGADQDCPVRALGRTEALLIQPRDAADSRARPMRLAEIDRLRVTETVDHEARLALPEVGAAVTATYDTDAALVEQILRSIRPTIRPTGPTAASTAPDPVVSDADPAAPAPVRPLAGPARSTVTGAGFDTCEAPSLPAMRAWRSSYQVVAIYVGGASRACGNGNLSRSWVQAVRAMGWHLVPTYVGPQAPCNPFSSKISSRDPRGQGMQAADDAIAASSRLGMPKGVPLYYDMEGYDSGNARCRQLVLSFLGGWTDRLRARGYLSGVYGSAQSTIPDLATAGGVTKPAAVWFGEWDGNPSVWASRHLKTGWWRNHQRLKQYRGPHAESHRGVRLNVDNDWVDGPVY